MSIKVSSSMQSEVLGASLGRNLGDLVSGCAYGVNYMGGLRSVGCSQNYHNSSGDGCTVISKHVSTCFQEQREYGNEIVLEADAGVSHSENQNSAGVGLELSANSTSDLYGFDYDNALKIIDVDSGCLIRVGCGEDDHRYVLNEMEMSCGNQAIFSSIAAEVIDEVSHKEVLDVRKKDSHTVLVDGNIFELSEALSSGIAGASFSPSEYVAVVDDFKLNAYVELVMPVPLKKNFISPDSVCPVSVRPSAEFAHIKMENFLCLCGRMAEIIPEFIQCAEDLGYHFSKEAKGKIINAMEEKQVQALNKVIKFVL